MESGPDGKWRPADATVVSAQFREGEGRTSSKWNVSYTYQVGQQIFTGKFKDYTSRSSNYEPGRVIPIDYLAANPARRRVVGITTAWTIAVLPMSIGIVGLVLVYLFFYLLTKP